MRTWWVRPNGNDSASGTSTFPFKTINKAGSVVNAGDTVNVMAGTYHQVVSLPRSGTATAPIKFVAVGDVYVSGLNLNPGEGLFNILGSYVRVSGFKVQDSNKFGLENCGHHNVITNCLIQRIERAGLITSDLGDDSRDTDHNSYVGNTITQVCLQNKDGKMLPGGWDSAINDYHGGSGNAGHNVYVWNDVHDTWGEGIVPSDDDVVNGNTWKNNWSVHIYVADKQRVSVTRNLCYDTENTAQHQAGRRAIGIGFADESSPARSNNNTAMNNFILNCGIGINYWNANTSGTGLKYDHVMNNTIVNSVNSGMALDGGAHVGTVIRNNIVWPRLGSAMSGDGASGIMSDHNIVKGQDPNPGLAGIGIPGDVDPAHYKIRNSLSSAYNSGWSSGAPSIDYFGGVRPQRGGIDVGAHELA